jgi:hypothetical protein
MPSVLAIPDYPGSGVGDAERRFKAHRGRASRFLQKLFPGFQMISSRFIQVFQVFRWSPGAIFRWYSRSSTGFQMIFSRFIQVFQVFRWSPAGLSRSSRFSDDLQHVYLGLPGFQMICRCNFQMILQVLLQVYWIFRWSPGVPGILQTMVLQAIQVLQVKYPPGYPGLPSYGIFRWYSRSSRYPLQAIQVLSSGEPVVELVVSLCITWPGGPGAPGDHLKISYTWRTWSIIWKSHLEIIW